MACAPFPGCAGLFSYETDLADVGQIAIALGIIDPIAHYKFVRDLKSGPIRLESDFASRGFVEKRDGFHPLGFAALQQGVDVMHGVSGVHDVFDYKNVAPLNGTAQVLEDSHLSAGLHATTIAGRLQEIDLERQIKLAHEVCDEDERSSQKPHDNQLVCVLEFVLYLRAERVNPCCNRLG